MGMKKYTDDYEMVTTTDKAGNEKQEIVYRGDYYEVNLDQEGIVKFKKKNILLAAVIFVFHVLSGFLNTQGMFQFYIAFPYVFAFLPIFNLAAGAFRLPEEARKFQRKEVGSSFDRIKNSSKILLVLLGIGIVDEIIFLLFFTPGPPLGLDYFYLILEILVGCAVYLQFRLQKELIVQKT